MILGKFSNVTKKPVLEENAQEYLRYIQKSAKQAPGFKAR